uniref:Uncharacterized protein n=1 Tax=Arundo donax TaxID=35708 RepID=A0A0A8Z706_ARUDO
MKDDSGLCCHALLICCLEDCNNISEINCPLICKAQGNYTNYNPVY